MIAREYKRSGIFRYFQATLKATIKLMPSARLTNTLTSGVWMAFEMASVKASHGHPEQEQAFAVRHEENKCHREGCQKKQRSPGGVRRELQRGQPVENSEQDQGGQAAGG